MDSLEELFEHSIPHIDDYEGCVNVINEYEKGLSSWIENHLFAKSMIATIFTLPQRYTMNGAKNIS